MKKASVVILCYNEEENVGPMAETLVDLFRHELAARGYGLIFVGNDSQGRTREYPRVLCAENHKIETILNAKSFGQLDSSYYGMFQSTGGATVLMVVDFRDPLEMIVKYVAAWEEGYRIVIDIKTYSTESPPVHHLRSLYHKRIREFSEIDQTEHFTDFGLYGKSFIQALRGFDDPTPFLRGIVVELSHRRKEIPCDQPRRRAGRTNNSSCKLYDAAVLSVTFYTKFGLHLVTFLGGITLVVSVVIALIYLMMKPLYWDRFWAGLAPLLTGMFFLGAMQIFFIDIVGEYVLTINQRVMKRPLVVEAERLNFESEDAEET